MGGSRVKKKQYFKVEKSRDGQKERLRKDGKRPWER